jgi:hypothetical protein
MDSFGVVRSEGPVMPLHDWTDERGWDSVLPFWLAYLVEWIRPRLPEGERAFLGSVPALTAVKGFRVPAHNPNWRDVALASPGAVYSWE